MSIAWAGLGGMSVNACGRSHQSWRRQRSAARLSAPAGSLASQRLGVRVEIAVDHPLDGERALDARAAGAPVERGQPRHARDRVVDASHRKPVSPSTTISGTEPMRAPSTGVPHAIASISVRPKRSGRVVMCTSASAPPSSSSRASRLHVPEELHARRRRCAARPVRGNTPRLAGCRRSSSRTPARLAISIARCAPFSG